MCLWGKMGTGLRGHTGGPGRPRGAVLSTVGMVRPSAWFLQSSHQAVLSWSFHLCGLSVKCFPGPGPLPGTHATITSGIALSARVPVDRMDTEAKCGGTCTGLPRQGSTQAHASAKPPLEGLCPSGSVVWLRGRDLPALVTWKGEEGLR